MFTLKLKILPALVFLFFGLIMWCASLVVPPVQVPHMVRHLLCIGFSVAGALLGAAGLFSFQRAHTTINPEKPLKASALVTSGIYRITRNPMYLGLLFILLSWAVFLSNLFALIFAAAFVVYMTEFQIKPEEKALLALFGTEYATYKTKVRRWL